MGNIILSLVLAMLSYSMLNIGMGLQKKGAASLPKIADESFIKNLKNFFTNKTWLLGFSLVQIQWFILALALDFGSLSIVTPMMAFGMVTLVLFSYFYLKEPISKIEFGGILSIITGIALLGVFNPKESEEYPLDYMNQALAKISSILFLIVIFVASIILLLFSILKNYAYADILFGIAAGIFDGIGAIFLKAYSGGFDFREISAISSSALRWEWWVYLVVLLFFNITATVFLQVAYQRGRAVIVAPIFAVIAMAVPVTGGIIILSEWSNLTPTMVTVKIISLIIISIGMIILSISSARNKRFEEQSLEDKQEGINQPATTVNVSPNLSEKKTHQKEMS
ncbi:MAG: hypothetical protein GF308_16405 [Candidatus Heimdallarchaeota archaeon]|nr:hypothetical protein [Candidatus Heimdallarchaeota archaeon]